MRFLGVTETCDLAALYLRLIAEGHEVRIAISDEAARGTGVGLIPQVPDWREALPWIRDAGAEGAIVFESVSEGFGALQDQLRGDGYRVIGGSAFGDRLENDRGFAQGLLAGLGLSQAAVHSFTDPGDAIRRIDARPARYVLKRSGAGHDAADSFVGALPDGSDVRALIAARADQLAGTEFILMEFVEGVEIGIGAYFDGERFLRPACLDWEHKRFFPGDMGELTGEMGTVATFARSERLFERTLALVEPLLRGHGHVGYVNLNTIVNEQGIWSLEFTCRFGYPGYAILSPLQETEWGALFRTMLDGSGDRFVTRPGYSVGVVITTPPFPYDRKQVDEPVGLPVLITSDGSAEDDRNIHFGEVGMAGGTLVTSGLYGWTMVATGTGATIREAQADCYARAHRIVAPRGRYRQDIGDRLVAGDLARLEALGLFGDDTG
jgi:phosphoribosylamine---glycine ligase